MAGDTLSTRSIIDSNQSLPAVLASQEHEVHTLEVYAPLLHRHWLIARDVESFLLNLRAYVVCRIAVGHTLAKNEVHLARWLAFHLASYSIITPGRRSSPSLCVKLPAHAHPCYRVIIYDLVQQPLADEKSTPRNSAPSAFMRCNRSSIPLLPSIPLPRAGATALPPCKGACNPW